MAHGITVPETILDELLCCFPPDFIRLTPELQRVSLELYHLLAKGRPVAMEQLAQTVSMTSDKVADILSRWSGVYYNAAGGVIGYWGLALSKTPHCIEVNGRRLYTWCAGDSLFIPGLLGTTTHVESRCPVTGDRIALAVTPDAVTGVSPPDVVMSFFRPDPRGFARM